MCALSPSLSLRLASQKKSCASLLLTSLAISLLGHLSTFFLIRVPDSFGSFDRRDAA
jgi:hypothetical protein